MNYWAQNLEILRHRRDPASLDLLGRLAPGGPADSLGLASRTGKPLPGWVLDGRPRALVSSFDPVKEAQRWVEAWKGGTLAVLGCAGREAYEALLQRDLRLTVWIEPRIEVWRSLLTFESGLGWMDQEHWVPWVSGPAELEAFLLGRYTPLWDGAFTAMEWKGATLGVENLWDGYREALGRCLEATASDASTQAKFGERWYRNTLANLRRLSPVHAPVWVGKRAVVAGAGPSLADELERPANQRWLSQRSATGDWLFSTDTALPALTARGIVPDLVFCLDGQLPTYHHFVAPPPRWVVLVADLASIPLTGRLGMPVLRYLSGHPFGLVIRRFFPEIPRLDGSLGNVSGLAQRTAWSLGAQSVDTWGVDFAYRNGQAYSRGTYVYDLAARRSNRLLPNETLLGQACYAAKGRVRVRDEHNQAWDTTPLLRTYRRLWEEQRPSPPRVILAHEGAQGRWEGFRKDWRERLEILPLPPAEGPKHQFFARLSRQTLEDWMALWPLALSLQRQGVPEARIAQETQQRALSFLKD